MDPDRKLVILNAHGGTIDLYLDNIRPSNPNFLIHQFKSENLERRIPFLNSHFCILNSHFTPPPCHDTKKVIRIGLRLNLTPVGVIANVMHTKIIDRFANAIAGADD
jgi:hypothetical protein